MLSFTGLQQFGAAANNIPSLLSMTSGPMPLMATNQFGNNGNGMNGNMNNGGRKSFGGGGGGGGGGRFSNYSSKGAFFKQNRQQGGHQQYQHQQQNQQQQQQQQQQQSRADKSVLCETCNIRLNSQQIYESHCKGAKHLKRLAQINAVLPHLPENAGQSTEVSSSSTGATTTITTTTTTSIVAAQSELKIETSLPAVKFDEDICAVSPVGDENQQPMETENNIANNTNSEQTPIKTEGTTTNQNETATSQVKSNNPNRRPNTYNYNKMVKRAAEKVVRVMHKCDVCNVGGMTDVSYLAHLSGKMHARKLKMNGGNNNTTNTTPVSQTNTTTTTTNITPTIEAINLSSDGESVQAVSCDEGPSNTEQQQSTAATSSDPSNIVQYRCDMCDVNLSSDAQLELHVSGVKHQKKIAQINKNKTANNAKIGGGGEIPMTTSTKTTPIKSEPVEYNCEICNIKLVSQQQLDIHLGGKKHKKKLASSSVIGPSVALADNKKNKEDDEKYAHLNIAWDKYRIVDTQSIPEAMRGKYEFYCVLCNKYMQKKPQLVDHLKCKRHHQKIYEKRQRDAGVLNPTAGSTTTTTTTGTKPMTNAGLNRPTAKSFRGGKVGGQTPRFNANKKINFVPGSSAGNKTSFMSYSTQSNNQMNSTGALSNNTQPSMNTLLSYPMSSFFGNSNQQSLQQELPGGGMKRKNVNGPQYDAVSNMNKMARMDNANQQNFAAAATQQQTSLVGANYGYGYGYDSFASFFSQQFNSNN